LKNHWKNTAIIAIQGRKLSIVVCCLATLGSVAFAFISPQIVRFTIDSIIGNTPPPLLVTGLIERFGGITLFKQNLWICAGLTAVMALASFVCDVLRNYTSIEIGETAAWKLRNDLYGHIQKLPYQWHVGALTGDIIQRCTTDVDNIRNFIHNQLSELMRTIIVFIVALVMMFSMDLYMSLASLALMPVIFIFSVFYFRKVSFEFNKADIAEGIMQAAAQENYTGVRVVRAFGREAYEKQKFSEKTETYQNIWVAIGKMLGVFWGAGDFLAGLQLTIIMSVGVYRCVHGNIPPGMFLAFFTYSNWMIWPVRQLGRVLADMSKTFVASKRIMEILDEKPEIDPPDVLRPELTGEICFNKVSFNYPSGEPVLHDISFSLKPGESMAILGATGSGKSTLVHLLNRLYDANEGLITIDGIDIRQIDRNHLRRNIGLCLQEPFLFSKTIRDNLALPTSDIVLSELRSAASVAMVDETIESFAEGYDTIIGERGVTLSGGQKQRIAIARMLVTNPPVMIFDDSLSALDTETDAKIRAALKKRVKDAAVIIISHRISSLMQADKILVLKDGTVEDIGSHTQLLGRSGSYRRIFDLQQGIQNG
jgi:ATP-binding cassette subfamily B protein